MKSKGILVVGGGIFGATAALSLARRGHKIILLETGVIPEPQASSTDISKLIRADYGDDHFYTHLMKDAFQGWRKWNSMFHRTLFHEVGALLLTKSEMKPGEFEWESYQCLNAQGYRLRRLKDGLQESEFNTWNARAYLDGYYNPTAGWAESGEVTAEVIRLAKEAGVEVRESEGCSELIKQNVHVCGVRTTQGRDLYADEIILCAGAWNLKILPELCDVLKLVGQPVIYFRPTDPSAFVPPHFVPWAADIARTGWYGFPVNKLGILKIANHGPGYEIDLSKPLPQVEPETIEAARDFLRSSIPQAAELPVVDTRVCLYCDSLDGDFLISRHPRLKGLTVATAGSGHAFKFAPLLGELTANAVEGIDDERLHRFRWRVSGSQKSEQARYTGE